jgi:plastocyanin
MKRLLLLITICISSVSFGQVPSYVPTNGLVGWWGFNGNANDESGNGNNGIVNGATLTTDRFGNANSAYAFDGIDDYIEVINTYDYENKTVSLWLNANDISGTWNDAKFAISIDSETLNYGMTNILIDTDSLSLRAGGETTVFRTPVNANELVHSVVIRTVTSTEYYLNGTYMGEGVSGSLGSSVNPNLNLVIGSGRTKTVQFFNGTIDDIGIWNRALTACEIQDLYNAQVANLSVNAGPDASICNGNELALSATANSGSTQTMDVTASSSTDYTFSGTYTGADPNITAEVGDTLVFNVNSPSHPFWIKTDPVTGTASAVSVANNGTGNGTISWVPDTPGTYYYICQFHSGMVGTITINASSTNITWNNGVTDGVPFTPLSSGYYTATATTGSCAVSDSLYVTLLEPTTSSITEVNCDSYTAPDGQTYTSTGNYTAVIPNAEGCDSTINIDLTITNSNSSSETVTECDSYTWATNGQTYTQSGQYTEVLPNQDGCDSTITLNLTIETVDITTQPVDQNVVVGNNAQFTVVTSASNPTYQWQMDDGTGWSNLSNAGQFSGTDTDVLTISNVQLNQNNFMYRCVVTSGNCETISSVARLTIQDNVGLEDLTKQGFTVFPNPTTNSFTITSEKVINSNFRIMDGQGREVLTGTMNGQEHTMDISKLSKGVYSVVFEQQDLPVLSVVKE